MEASIPGSIEPDTLFHALALNGTSLLVLDPSGSITWASDAAHALFDCEDSDQLNGVRWETLIQIDGASVWDPALDVQYEAQGFLRTDGYCDAGKRGRIAIELVMVPNRGSAGRLVVIRDVTERKSYEQQFEEDKQHVESLNHALQTEIGKANELAVMAERANIAKSVFLTSMSHEFRTPLNGVLGYAQILAANDVLHPECRKAAATIERCGQHLLSIINDVLDLSKIEAGRIEVAEEPLNLRTLITEVMDVFQVRAVSKGLKFSCEYDGSAAELQWILGDGKLIRQILINLIGNAVKFTDQGTILLRIATDRAISDDPDGVRTGLRLSVMDTGPGIERRHLDQVFEEFYQTEAFSGHKGGTGLGLAISRKLAVAMGGRLSVESKIGEGSSFHLELSTRPIVDFKAITRTPLETHGLQFAEGDLGFIQVFNEALDSGVLKGVMATMGMNDGRIYDVKQSLFEVQPALHNTWLLGVSAGGLLADSAQDLLQWASRTPGRVIVLLYLDRSQSKCQRLFEALAPLQAPVIALEIPIHIATLKASLVEACGDLFQPRVQTDAMVDTVQHEAMVGERSDEIPDTKVLRRLLQSAQVGDMREFNRRLESWAVDLGMPSHFEDRVRHWVDAFKIDQLCRFLEQMLYHPDAAASNDLE